MGDNIHVADGTAVEFQLRATDCSGGMAAVILDGRPAKTYAIDGNDRTGTVSLTLGGGRHWVRATLQDAAGSLVALTNPIYVNY